MQEKNLNELLKNETFINYCLKRNEQDVSEWENRIKENPETKIHLEELKVLVLAMGLHAGQKAADQNYLKLRMLITKGYVLKKRYLLSFFGWISSAAAVIILPIVLVFCNLTKESLHGRVTAVRFLDVSSAKHKEFHQVAGHSQNSLIYSAKYRPEDYVSLNQLKAIM
ncbi:hypothetical protein H7F33_09555 [Pedobacter sp. PAMC26386]|nr:hypothetical protein H7F33_09555 [Pedobacter sp. PAMC26386]